jgi:hypothetical protein
MELILPILAFISGSIWGVVCCANFQAKELARKEREWFSKGYKSFCMDQLEKNKERRLRRVK